MKEYEYDEENALQTNIESDAFVVNDQGNIVQIGDHSYFEYDINDRLVESQVNHLTVTYTYDKSGKRITKTIEGETEKYIYFGANEIAILDGEDRVKQLRIPGLPFRKGVLRPVAIETENAIYAPIHDIQGNIVKLIDIESQKMISLKKPDPFGDGLSEDSPSPWIFSGKHYDSDTGLVYYGARFYSPKIRKWLTEDPLFESNDLYQYCLNNPFYYFDPDGRSSEEAQEHYDNAKKALVEAVAHSIGSGVAALECPPLAVAEAYQATTSFIESAKEYNKGYEKEQEDKEKKKKND
ncbi:MAG: RHS repeat-associated core domain-containing protein [Candidatus Algichlamydia australiensis]|nr:RHS repeat-associated core domain-containing protein [Chlamydiales bacterium]